MKPIIRVENLSKKYRLGITQKPYSTIRESIVDSIKAPFRKYRMEESNTLWALRDINFEINPGEVVGIIGKNGAGKSTLLKILSRITEPSAGKVELYGRIASLLEVGTGFHHELTGRENIFLNGAILGMSRKEIEKKFDEIVAFAEIEKFLDTAVKHYSSGMYVRLAFAVAAHLEPEILVVDEVLAVGDTEFQKKCLGKMGEVSSQEGRTVLIVSHNIPSLLSLCQKGLLIEKGKLIGDGNINQIVDLYTQRNQISDYRWKVREEKNLPVYFEELAVEIKGSQPELKLEINSLLKVNDKFKKSFIAFDIYDANETPLMQAIPIEKPFLEYKSNSPINVKTTINLPPMIPGRYLLSCWIGSDYAHTIDYEICVLAFEIQEYPVLNRSVPYTKNCGFLVPPSTVETTYSAQ